jgi:hypothetical protein
MTRVVALVAALLIVALPAFGGAKDKRKSAAGPNAKVDGPSIEETVAWLKPMLEHEVRYRQVCRGEVDYFPDDAGIGRSRDTDTTDITERYSDIVVNDCSVKWKVHTRHITDSVGELDGTRDRDHRDESETFESGWDFKDLRGLTGVGAERYYYLWSPEDRNCGGTGTGTYSCSTTPDVWSVTWTTDSKNSCGNTQKMSGQFGGVSYLNPQAAEKVARAFRHLAKLCGGADFDAKPAVDRDLF